MRLLAIALGALAPLGIASAQRQTASDAPGVQSPFILTTACDDDDGHNAFFF